MPSTPFSAIFVPVGACIIIFFVFIFIFRVSSPRIRNAIRFVSGAVLIAVGVMEITLEWVIVLNNGPSPGHWVIVLPLLAASGILAILALKWDNRPSNLSEHLRATNLAIAILGACLILGVINYYLMRSYR